MWKHHKQTNAYATITDAFYEDFFSAYLYSDLQLNILDEENRICVTNVEGAGDRHSSRSKSKTRSRSRHSMVPKPASIKRPITFPTTSIPANIREHINHNTRLEIKAEDITMPVPKGHQACTVSLYFYLEKSVVSNVVIEAAFLKVLTWLNMIYLFKALLWGSPLGGCAPPKHLNCFFYLTSVRKYLPAVSGETLGETHANTGFTRTCVPDVNEIVIYRLEEWFKVFVHETIHAFGLDFSDVHAEVFTKANSIIFAALPGVSGNSKVNLYEAYTEFWAEIVQIMMDVLFGALERSRAQKRAKAVDMAVVNYTYRNNRTYFQNQVHKGVMTNREFGMNQMRNVLKHMGFTSFAELADKKVVLELDRDKKYVEDTNILSYYILKNILMYNFEDFLVFDINDLHKDEHMPKGGRRTFLAWVYFIPYTNRINSLAFFIQKCVAVVSQLNLKFNIVGPYHEKHKSHKSMRMTSSDVAIF